VIKIRLSKTRYYIMTAGILIIIAAGAWKFGLGTYCSVCPVGFLEVTAASRAIPTDMLAGVVVTVFAVLIFGRFFCGWLCSTTLIKHIAGQTHTNHKSAGRADSVMHKMPFIILILAVGISFIVRFPVFCLVCPIGLFFGLIFAVFRTVFALEPSWNLIIFPAILTIELLIFRKWCSYICPISAMFSLISKVPFIKARPIANAFSCFSKTGGHCSHCRDICPEEIEVVNDEKAVVERCTSCMECADNCVSGSIHYEILKPKRGVLRHLVNAITKHF